MLLLTSLTGLIPIILSLRDFFVLNNDKDFHFVNLPKLVQNIYIKQLNFFTCVKPHFHCEVGVQPPTCPTSS